MEREVGIEIVQREATRIIDLIEDAGDDAAHMRLPSCPDWTLPDLADHLGRVYAMVDAALATGSNAALEPSSIPRRPDGQAPAEWLAERLGILLDALGSVREDARCWNFVDGPGGPVAFWWRRQAHETLIHRVDAEQASGAGVTPADPELAADGIGDFLEISGLREVAWDEVELGRGLSIHLHATDEPGAEWTVDTERRTYALAHLKADVALRGPSFALDLWCWRRGKAPEPGTPPQGEATGVEATGVEATGVEAARAEAVGPPPLASDLEAFGDVAAAEEWLPAL